MDHLIFSDISFIVQLKKKLQVQYIAIYNNV